MKINHLRAIWARHSRGSLGYPALISQLVPGDMGPGLRLAPEDVSFLYILPAQVDPR